MYSSTSEQLHSSGPHEAADRINYSTGEPYRHDCVGTHFESLAETAATMFFVFDGIDGAGKSTQIARFVGWLRSLGHEVLECRDPGGTALGEKIRGLLLEPSDLPIDSRAETLLYMASRAQLVSEVIAPALQAGRTVVSDRYVSANVAYQGFGSGLSPEQIAAVGEFATGGIMPDRIFVLDLDAQTAARRIDRPVDRIEARGIEYFNRVRTGFLKLSEIWPGRVELIDASGDADQIHEQIVRATRHWLDQQEVLAQTAAERTP